MEEDDDDNDDDGRIGVRNEGNESVAENAKLSSIGKSWNEKERERERVRELWKRQRKRENRPQRRREREERTQQKRARVERSGTWIYPPSPSPSHCLSVDPWDPPDWLHDDPTLPSSRPCYLHTLTSFTDFHGQTEASRGSRISFSFDFFRGFGLSTRKPSLYIVYRGIGRIRH